MLQSINLFSPALFDQYWDACDAANVSTCIEFHAVFTVLCEDSAELAVPIIYPLSPHACDLVYWNTCDLANVPTCIQFLAVFTVLCEYSGEFSVLRMHM